MVLPIGKKFGEFNSPLVTAATLNADDAGVSLHWNFIFAHFIVRGAAPLLHASQVTELVLPLVKCAYE